MSIANQIQRIKTNITNAYNEIEKFNVNISEYNNKSDKLAEAISNITVGETINNQNKIITENGTYTYDEGYTGLGEVVVDIENTIPSVVATDDVCRKNLCYWMDAIDNRGIWDIDGTRNTTAGNWWSKSGFCYFAPYNNTSTTTWNEDSVTYNSSYRGVKEVAPCMYNFKSALSEVTYEVTFSMNNYPSSGNISHIIGNIDGLAGSRIYIGPTGNVASNCIAGSTGQVAYDTITQNIPLNQRVYVCARMKQGVVSLYSTQSNIITIKEFTDTVSNLCSVPITVAYDGTSTGAYEGNQSNINVSSFRVYNRYITDEEMLANCKYEVDRFNIPEYRILIINSNVDGTTVELAADGYTQTDNYIKVLKGTEVTYSVSADGYKTQFGSIVLDGSTTLDIILEASTDLGPTEPDGGFGDGYDTFE